MKGLKALWVLALVFVGLVFSTGVSAYRGDYSIEGPNCDDERHELMEESFELLDYDGWYALMTEDGRHPRVVDVVNADNFALFVQAHEAGEAGDAETAAKLRAELGLNNGNGPRDGTGHGKKMGEGNGLRDGTGQGKGMSHELAKGKSQGKGCDRQNRDNSNGIHKGLGKGRGRV